MPLDLESISYAFLTLLQTLTPLERAVYLLREVFGYSHAEVARMTGREEAAVRQLHHRARESVLARRPRFAADRSAHERLVSGFAAACRTGDFEGLRALLADDAVMRSDGGGKAPAISRPLRGAIPIAKTYIGFAKHAPEGTRLEVRDVNGLPALVVWVADELRSVVSFESDGARIVAAYAMVNPDKLARLASAWRASA
jgi:RNA polymerase sigma-70 factor (ECF subfamily)